MYSNPSQTPSWNPNAPQQAQQAPSPSQTPVQQPQWGPQPTNGQFAPRANQIPPISQALPQQGPMQTMQPQHPDQYRALPAPPQMYAPPYPQQPQMQYAPAQPAPRQRTAIACRYCRRRKIRCSGFDQSEDGRCTNCQRFSQECVFTPVSAQTQAFVPAHTVWRGPPPANAQLYGAYGQPLRNDPYAPLPPQGQPQAPPSQQQQQQQQAGQYPPPPPQGYQQQPYQQAAPMQGTKRPTDEPHTPTLPPPQPGYVYPEPANLNGVARDDSVSGLSLDGTERKNERLRNGEIRDFGVQTDESAFAPR